MKKTYVFPIIGLFLHIIVIAQPGVSDSAVSPKGMDHSASLDLHIPVSVFSGSHFGGLGLGYSWSHHRYGRKITPSKLIGFIFSGTADYYFGKKIKPAGHDFRYGGYFYGAVHAGIITNPWSNANLSLTAGPTMGVYKGSSSFGYGINLFGNYYFRRNISIGPGLTYKKHAQADALWAAAVRVSYNF